MLSSLGAKVMCCGVRGDDHAGKMLHEQLMHSYNCDTEGLLVDHNRPTTLKTRYSGYVQSAGRGIQQMLRVDEESVEPIDKNTATDIKKQIKETLDDFDLLLIQDMAKGLLDKSFIREIIGLVRDNGKPVVIDPSIKQSYTAYSGATCILPNRMEAAGAVGKKLENEQDYSECACRFVNELKLDFAVITLDCEGMFYATKDGEQARITTAPRSVLDVTGAGDMVASMMATALANGVSVRNTVRLANAAAGLEVLHQGAAPLSLREIENQLRIQAEPSQAKIKRESDIHRAYTIEKGLK